MTDSSHSDDQSRQTTEIPGFKPFTVFKLLQPREYLKYLVIGARQTLIDGPGCPGNNRCHGEYVDCCIGHSLEQQLLFNYFLKGRKLWVQKVEEFVIILTQ